MHNINDIEITRYEAGLLIKILEDQWNLSDEAEKVLEFLKRATEAPVLDEVESVPTWALEYLEYGEDDSLEENERRMIDEFLKDNRYKFSSVKDGDGCEFDAYPLFGKACSTCTCYFEVLKTRKDDPGDDDKDDAGNGDDEDDAEEAEKSWVEDAIRYSESIGVYEFDVNGHFMEYWTFYGGEGWYFVRYDLKAGKEVFRGAKIPDTSLTPKFLLTEDGAAKYNYMEG